MAYYGPFGGGGVAATFNQHTIADEFTGPASYTTGGFTVDLSKTFSSLNSLELVVKKGSRGPNLPAVLYEITLNAPSSGKAKVKIVRKRYNRVSVGNPTDVPILVLTLDALGAESGPEGSHTHSIDHNHGSFSSGVNNNGGGSVLLDAAGPNLSYHTHTLDIPNLTGTSSVPDQNHYHRDNSIYQHSHDVIHDFLKFALVELGSTTNLSATTWYLCATGVKL